MMTRGSNGEGSRLRLDAVVLSDRLACGGVDAHDVGHFKAWRRRDRHHLVVPLLAWQRPQREEILPVTRPVGARHIVATARWCPALVEVAHLDLVVLLQ